VLDDTDAFRHCHSLGARAFEAKTAIARHGVLVLEPRVAHVAFVYSSGARYGAQHGGVV